MGAPTPPTIAGMGQLYQGTIDGVDVGDWLTAYQAPGLTIVGYAEIWTSINDGYASQTLLGTFPLVAGTVTIDRANSKRRSATNVTMLADSLGDLLPIAGTDDGWFAPYGNEMRIFKGIEIGGVAKYCQLGHYLISATKIRRDANGLVFVGTMTDNGEWISRLTYTYNWSTDGSISDGNAVIDQILYNAIQAWFGIAVPFPTGVWTTISLIPPVMTFISGDDPWQESTDLAAALGVVEYFDYQGDINLVPTPDPLGTPPCVAYEQASSTSSVAIERNLDNTEVPNVIGVVSAGSSVALPILVWWWDSNPASPTFYAAAPGDWTLPQYTLPPRDSASTYPTMMQVFSTNLIGPGSQDVQAQAFAVAIGLTSIGSIEKATFTIRAQPAHDIDDVVQVSNVIAGIPSLTSYVLDQVVIDLAADGTDQLTGRLVST